MKEAIRICNNEEEITKTISYGLQFIDSARFMASSFSNLVNNLSEVIHKTKCKQKMITEKLRCVELITKIANAALNIQILMMI